MKLNLKIGSAAKISSREKIRTKPNLSVVALTSFLASFVIARTFTTLYPRIIWEISGFHIHHFWYGLIMLAIGGWLGINVEDERLSRMAAIFYGAGGGLIVDEVGLLLTLSAQAYWADFTYTFAIIFSAVVSIFVLISKYNKMMRAEFGQFLSSNGSFYLGVFLVAISLAFVLETDNIIITTVSSILAIVAFIIILAYFVQRIRKRR